MLRASAPYTTGLLLIYTNQTFKDITFVNDRCLTIHQSCEIDEISDHCWYCRWYDWSDLILQILPSLVTSEQSVMFSEQSLPWQLSVVHHWEIISQYSYWYRPLLVIVQWFCANFQIVEMEKNIKFKEDENLKIESV